MSNFFTPRTAPEASRLIRSTEAAARLEAGVFWAGNGTCTLDSWKTNEEGKRVKRRYELDLNKSTCTCPDFRQYGQFCKHLLYAEAIARSWSLEEAQEAALAQLDADAANSEGAFPF